MAPRNESGGASRRPPLVAQTSYSKASTLISPTPSAEADDENSSVSDIESAMVDSSPARYDGEDTRPTSQKELWGWYSYGWAAETFAIVVMASFMPITLEQLARENGVLLADKSKSCKADWTPAPPNSFNGTKMDIANHRPKELPACVVYILGSEVNTASFAMYTFSISVLVQALLIVSMSGAADHGRFRKTFLLALAAVGSISIMLFIAVVPKIYLFGALLAIIGNTCFGASFVLLNSFLPLLVRYHPSVLRSHGTEDQSWYSDDEDLTRDDERDGHMANSTDALLPRDQPDDTQSGRPIPAAVSPELKLSTQISSYGIGIGYIAGLLVQMLGIFIVVMTGSTTFSLRLVLLVAGLWWGLFTIPAALWLRPRPGPPLPSAFSESTHWYTYVTYAWKSLFKTIGRAKQLKDIVIFLAAWFLLSDSIATVSGTAVLFAKTTLGMKTAALGLINVIATLAGIVGAFYWSFFSKALNLRPSQTIVACICLFEIIPLYGLLGFIPAVQNLGVLGLQQPWEMYPLGAIYGFVLASFYALYAITDKGSSVLGPAVVGAITDRYGEIRPAFVFLAVLIFLPLPLMLLVDVDRGKGEAKMLAEELEGKKKAGENGSPYSAVPTLQLPNERSPRSRNAAY